MKDSALAKGCVRTPLSDSSSVSESRTPASSSIRKTVPSSFVIGSSHALYRPLRGYPSCKSDNETRAAEAARLAPQIATLMAQQGAAQGKAQAHTADFAGDEGLEQAFGEIRRNPGSRIIDTNQHIRAARLRRNLDAPAAGSLRWQGVERVKGIREQIVHGDLELCAIDHYDRHALAVSQLELHRAATHAVLQCLRHLRAHRHRVGRLESHTFTAIELPQPPQHGGRSSGFLAGLAHG